MIAIQPMKDSTVPVASVLALAIWCVSPQVACGDDLPDEIHPSTVWKAGYAEADITPKPGEPVMPAGFGKPRMMDGIESPLRAQALALEDADGKRAIMFTADVLGFGRLTVDAVRHKIQVAHQMAPEAICFTASHTHWGPAVNYRTGPNIGSVNMWYLSYLETTLLELADEALRNLASAEVAYGDCEAHIGMCRRLPGKDGQIGWGPYPAGSYDPHTPIIHIRMLGAAKENPNIPQQVVIVGHACHPTSMGNTGKWSPDYPGAMRRKLEAELKDCRAMFVMGCGGDAKVVYRDPDTGEHKFAASLERSH
jgi:neutral ceramidase